jgi:hypothetical protein
MMYKGMYGFKAYYSQSIVAGGPSSVYEPIPNNKKWFFYTWDATKREYVEVEEVLDESFQAVEPEEAALLPAAEPEAIEEDMSF